MESCKSCGRPLLTSDRGNIQPSYPNGFSHKICPETSDDIKHVVEPLPFIKDEYLADGEDDIKNEPMEEDGTEEI